MRKLLAILIMGLMLSLPLSVFAAGSVSQSVDVVYNSDLIVVTFTWVGDSGNGTVPNTATNTAVTEAIIGAYLATRTPASGATKTFATKADAMAAYKRGEIQMNTPVKIQGRG